MKKNSFAASVFLKFSFLFLVIGTPFAAVADEFDEVETRALEAQCVLSSFSNETQLTQVLVFDDDLFQQGKAFEFEGYQFEIRSLYKFGDYDTTPNLFVKVSESSKEIFSVVLLASRDEYGAVSVGDSSSGDSVDLRCDVTKRE